MDNPTPPAPISPKSPISLNLAFLIITLVSLLLSAFFIYQNWRLTQKLDALIQSQPTPTPSVANPPLAETPSADLTANWKTYTNTKYGYSISYPVSYVLTNIAGGGTDVVPQNAENISISESSNIKYGDRLMDLSHLGLLVDVSPANQWQKTSVTIAGVKSTKFTKIDKLSNFDYYHIPTKGTEGIELMINNKQQAKVDQILSTFKFIN